MKNSYNKYVLLILTLAKADLFWKESFIKLKPEKDMAELTTR